MPRPPRVVIAGSRALPPGQATRILIRFLAGLPAGTTIVMRRGVSTSPGPFESQVEGVCELVGLDVEWRQPQPGKRKEEDILVGRRATFSRDVEMIDSADLVLTFVMAAHELLLSPKDTSGTAKLAELAVFLETPVYSYQLTGGWGLDEAWTRVGEHDPDNTWAEMVPTAAHAA